MINNFITFYLRVTIPIKRKSRSIDQKLKSRQHIKRDMSASPTTASTSAPIVVSHRQTPPHHPIYSCVHHQNATSITPITPSTLSPVIQTPLTPQKWRYIPSTTHVSFLHDPKPPPQWWGKLPPPIPCLPLHHIFHIIPVPSLRNGRVPELQREHDPSIPMLKTSHQKWEYLFRPRVLIISYAYPTPLLLLADVPVVHPFSLHR